MTSEFGGLSFSRIADSYDATRGGLDRGARHAELIAPFMVGERLLEVGIGTGLVAVSLTERGRHVLGVDLSPEMTRYAVRRIGARACVGDAARLPFASGSIDTCYSVWVLHLVDIAATLGETWRVLRPRGRYVVVGASDDRSDDVLTDILRRLLDGLHRRPALDHPDRVAELANLVGFQVTRIAGEPQSWATTPAEMIDLIESKSFSFLWQITDEQWHDHVEPAITALRSLPDEPVQQEETPTVLVLTRPAGN